MRNAISAVMLLVALLIGGLALAGESPTWKAKRVECEAIEALTEKRQAIRARRASHLQALRECDADDAKLNEREAELVAEISERLGIPVKDQPRLRFAKGVFSLADVAEVATPTALPK